MLSTSNARVSCLASRASIKVYLIRARATSELSAEIAPPPSRQGASAYVCVFGSTAAASIIPRTERAFQLLAFPHASTRHVYLQSERRAESEFEVKNESARRRWHAHVWVFGSTSAAYHAKDVESAIKLPALAQASTSAE